MLTTLNLKVGSILHDMEQNIDHRVIYMNKDYFVTIWYYVKKKDS